VPFLLFSFIFYLLGQVVSGVKCTILLSVTFLILTKSDSGFKSMYNYCAHVEKSAFQFQTVFLLFVLLTHICLWVLGHTRVASVTFITIVQQAVQGNVYIPTLKRLVLEFPVHKIIVPIYTVGSLLWNGREMSGYIRTVSGQRLGKHVPAATDANATVTQQ
jgi:hypothetical protein